MKAITKTVTKKYMRALFSDISISCFRGYIGVFSVFGIFTHPIRFDHLGKLLKERVYGSSNCL
jgi:hypothetical protein